PSNSAHDPFHPPRKDGDEPSPAAQGRGGKGLLSEGVADAELAAAALEDHGIDLLYSSDQQRAVETARVIRSRLGLPRIRMSAALREMDYGKMSGRGEAD